MKKISVKLVVYTSIISLVFLMLSIFAPLPSSIEGILIPFFFIFSFVFLLSGIFLILLSKKQEKKLKITLILIGISAISPLLFSVLHNVFYALAIKFEILKFLFEVLSASSFIIAIIISPALFIIGIIRYFILTKKN